MAETHRLIIRELKMDDLDELYHLYEDEDVKKYNKPLAKDRKAEEERLKAYIENMYKFYEMGFMALISKQDGGFVGIAGLNPREYQGKTVIELGYAVNNKYRRQGFAKEACLKIIKYAREELEVEPVCFIDDENLPSRALASSLDISVIV